MLVNSNNIHAVTIRPIAISAPVLGFSLTRPDPRHVMVLAQSREILIQLLDTLLVCLHALTFETVVELYHAISNRPKVASPGQ